jgi:hypothetical protein
MKVEFIKSKSKNIEKIIKFIEKNHQVKKKYNWKNLFTQFRFNKNKSFGVALLNNHIIKGFLGTVHSTIKIRNKNYDLCNTSTWVVDKNVRGRSLLLLHKILNDKKKVFIAHTVIDDFVAIHKKFGFEIFEDEVTYSIISPFSLIKKFFNLREKKIQIVNLKNYKEIKDKIYKKIVLDHLNFQCQIYFINNIILIGKIKSKFNLKYFEVLDCSNKNFFSEQYRTITEILCREKNFIFIRFDRRFINNQKSLTFTIKTQNKKMIKFPNNIKLKKKYISNLYSEIFLLDI